MKYKLLVMASALSLCACHHVDDDRIPPTAVYIPFTTVGDWNVYGVAGAGSYRNFIKASQQPPGYPYTAISATGYGGVLLIGDVHNNFVAYDLSCPVECSPTVRIGVVQDELIGQCPKCLSTYDLVTNYGYPLSGPAAEHGYALQRYYVGPGPSGEYMVISR